LPLAFLSAQTAQQKVTPKNVVAVINNEILAKKK